MPVAQLDRASASGVEGLAFESRRAYHFFCLQNTSKLNELQLVFFFYLHQKRIALCPIRVSVIGGLKKKLFCDMNRLKNYFKQVIFT